KSEKCQEQAQCVIKKISRSILTDVDGVVYLWSFEEPPRPSATPCGDARRGIPLRLFVPSFPDTEVLKGALILAPVRSHLDVQFQVNLPTEQLFQILTGGNSGLFEQAPGLPDHNSLLGVALHMNGREDTADRFGFF